MEFARAMSALRRRRWWILLGVCGCTAFTAAGASRMKHEYLATATLMPEERALSSVRELSTPELVQERQDLTQQQDKIKTVAAIVGSPAVVGTVIQDLHIATTPSQLLERMDVQEMTSQILHVSVKDSDPRLASAIINDLVTVFTRYYGELRSREARRQVEEFERQGKDSEQALAAASNDLQRFKERDGISSLPDQTHLLLERSGQIDQDKNAAEAHLREVTAQLAATSALLARTPATREMRRQSTNTALLDKLRLDVAGLQQSLEKELTVHTEEHPNVKRLQEELTQAQRRLDTASAKMDTSVEVVPNPDVQTIRTSYNALENELKGVTAKLASLNRNQTLIQSKVANLSGKDVGLAVLTERYNLAEQRHTAIMNRLGQLQNAADLISSGQPISVVDVTGARNPPLDLSRGRVIRLTALAFLLSLAIAITVAVGLDLTDPGMESLAGSEFLTRFPLVSVVSQLPGGAAPASLCTMAADHPTGPMAESYHFLANRVLLQTIGNESTVLMGLTARPCQGATTALSNLGIALARAGRQVVLVESDLRRPFLHEVFQTGTQPGLSDVIRKQVSLSEALYETGIEGLRVLPAGSPVDDPWSLLWNPQMNAVVHGLRAAAQFVIFNVPSATQYADALSIAPQADGAILVMRTDQSPSAAEETVRNWVDEVNIPVIGLILNGVPQRDLDLFSFRGRAGAPEPGLPALTEPAIGGRNRPLPARSIA